MAGTIHVTCGHCDLYKARSSRLRDIVALRDNLSYGPLAPFGDLDGWCAMRQAYWDQLEGKPCISTRESAMSGSVAIGRSCIVKIR